MAQAKKVAGKNDFVWVRSIYGKGPNAKERYSHIPDGGMNAVIKDWQDKQPERERDVATPSTLLTCPRVIWLLNKGVEPTNEMTWAVKQRLLLGRLFENQFAVQLEDQGLLLKHWRDDPGVEQIRFEMGKGIHTVKGTPDYLTRLTVDNQEIVAISDGKTSRSDSFGYIGLEADEAFEDWGWYKYRIQVTAYYMLAHQNKEWFLANKLPLPTHCHLFSYALDDGVIRREFVWQPTEEDMQTVIDKAQRFNRAITSPTLPPCTCSESTDNFDVKFCKFGVVEQGSKIADTCCSEDLVNAIKEKK